jgi:hypothetical protein
MLLGTSYNVDWGIRIKMDAARRELGAVACPAGLPLADFKLKKSEISRAARGRNLPSGS